jgi:Flp pilus assembly protein TadG
MSFRPFSTFGRALRRLSTFGRLARSEAGNVALMFAFAVLPMVIISGFGIDYVRYLEARSQVQGALDGATLMGAGALSAKADADVVTAVRAWTMEAYDVGYGTLTVPSVVIERSKLKVTSTASLVVPSAFGSLIGFGGFQTLVTSAAVAPNRPYMNVYLLLDNSASMGLAATTAGQTTMSANVGCVFACHTDEGGTFTIKGVIYHTTFAAAQALGVTLRRDVMNSAAKKVISMIDTVDPAHQRIKVGVYYFNQDVTKVQDPTFDTTKATAALAGSASNLGVDGTYFDTSLATMKSIVGSAGDGSSASSPLKLVLMVTDGVQSQRSWVLTNVNWTCVAWSGSTCIKYKHAPYWQRIVPNKPANCDGIKSNGATFGVLYTEYLSIPLDWGYNGTVGDTMPSNWGKLSGSVSSTISRRDYLPYALKDCASSGYFMAANSTTDIESGLTSLFDRWIEHLRLAE